MARLMNLWRQPLLHFLLLGAGIFALNAAFNGGNDADQSIVVTATDVARLSEVWQRQWGRPPNEAELRGMVDQQVREEVLYREAVALGLDKDDIIIRRRLAQKVEFIAEDLSVDTEPTQAELDAFYAAHPQRYLEPSRLTFSQLYFSRDRHGQGTDARADAALERLRSELALDDAAVTALADPFMLQSAYADRSAPELDRLFGGNFGARLAALPTGSWQGPVPSSFGMHLIHITTRSDARLPPLAEIRDAVARDVLDAKRRDANARFYETLRTRYRIDIAPDALPPKPDPAS